MAGTSNIEWTDATWNPIAGCSIVSAGCTNCYAMKMANRIDRMSVGKPSHYHGTTKVVNGKEVWTGVVNAAPDHILLQPLKWKKPRRIFVNSMSDLFHEAVPDEVIDKVFAVMALCPQHTFQILTKRSKRMREYLDHEDLAMQIGVAAGNMLDGEWVWNAGRKHRQAIEHIIALAHGLDDEGECRSDEKLLPLRNVHLGVSCENQATADERIPDLLATPAAVRFVSAEPLLGTINFQRISTHTEKRDGVNMWRYSLNKVAELNFHGLDQIIVGGESGHGFRPMQIEWAEDIMRQCKEAGTAFFFKQDSAFKSGQQGSASPALWASKQMVGE